MGQRQKTTGGILSDFETFLVDYNGDYEAALFKYCFIHNVPYVSRIVKLLTSGNNAEALQKMPQIYVDTVNADCALQGVTFFDQLRRTNFEKIYATDAAIESLDEDSKKNRLAVIDILAYDPFHNDAAEDKPQLYRDMASMLTESMRKDVAKAKAALSVVRGYSNLEKYQRKINDIMRSGAVDDETQKSLDQYIKVQKTLQDSINTTAEKNNFTVKGIGSNGRGMLSDVMTQIEEKGIDEGVTNFYDIATSRSIEEVANISFKAQLNQINLSKTDYADILATQCQIVQEAQKKVAQAYEALRTAKEKLVKQELLEELEQDYRAKGISEDEIESFLRREFHMYDGAPQS